MAIGVLMVLGIFDEVRSSDDMLSDFRIPYFAQRLVSLANGLTA